MPLDGAVEFEIICMRLRSSKMSPKIDVLKAVAGDAAKRTVDEAVVNVPISNCAGFVGSIISHTGVDDELASTSV